MPSDDTFTDEQRAGAEYRGGHARLLAGPGTGKTQVMTHRAQILVRDAGINPEEILILTFTRAAAAELRSRLRNNLGADVPLPRVSTLHGFALRQLLRNSEHAAVPQPIRIADDYEQRWVIEEDLAQILELKIRDVQHLFHLLSNDWESLRADVPEWGAAFERDHPRFLGAWREHRAVFGYTLRGELVYQLKNALEQRDIRIDRPTELLVDEYQDLNACDQAIVRRLAAMGAHVYSAGDDDQSIYGFRFADPTGIRRFTEDFEGAAPLTLRVCHRCARNILRAALHVARQDPDRLEKELVPREGAEEGDVRLYRFSDNSQETRATVTLCERLIANGVRPRDILILFRSDRNGVFSEPIREALAARGIPVLTKTDPLAALNSPKHPGRQFVATLRLISDPTDSLGWRTLLKERPNGIGDETLMRMYQYARTQGRRFGQVLDEIGPVVRSKAGAVATEVATIRTLVMGLPHLSGESDDLGAALTEIAASTIDDANMREEVLTIFRTLVSETEPDSLDTLLKVLGTSLGEDTERDAPVSDAVSLMTMHQAKGLTAEAVFIVAAENESVPGHAETKAEADDARRLLYVSMTRARRFLYMTFCNDRRGPQAYTGPTSGKTTRHLTPFLTDLPNVPIALWHDD
ncbi:MAG TPA: ATP-dependent helicase [bacterium]|nr:ATP-dependent helicase [bacterium]